MVVSPRNIFALQIIAILLAMLNLSNIKIEYVADFLPLFDVMIIYYFAILRPQIFAVWFLFLLGMISDAINGFPLGITALSYIIAVKSFNAFNQHTIIDESFQRIFGQFIAFVFCILSLKWLFLSIYNLQAYNIITPLIQLIITSTIYVFMHKFFGYLDRKLLSGA
ncbi:MAG: hypothetical protein K0R25_1310 [Rickettsiaceae bacterium]|jgi:rod shape-determining protein MreD|nr:hypothetical protein [Rickettsiaceae bacterium]